MSDDCSILSRMGRAVFAGLVVAILAPPCLAEPGPSAAVPGGSNAGETLEANPEIRRLRLKHHGTGENLDVVYRIGGAYQPEAMARIDHFMRDWRCGKVMEMDPTLIDRIYELHQRIGTRRTIRLVSGFRSEGYNASLLVSGRTVDPESQHMFGRAVDIFVPGLGTDKLKEAAQALALGGVGHYPYSGPRFVHIDTGPQRHWTEMDPGARRRLGLAKRERTRFKLRCDMTMADALREISPIDAIAALPPGAAVDPAASFQRAAFAQAAPPTDRAQWPGGENDVAVAPVHTVRNGACEADDPLPPLGLLAGAQDLREPH